MFLNNIISLLSIVYDNLNKILYYTLFTYCEVKRGHISVKFVSGSDDLMLPTVQNMKDGYLSFGNELRLHNTVKIILYNMYKTAIQVLETNYIRTVLSKSVNIIKENTKLFFNIFICFYSINLFIYLFFMF
jgi:hypothetical protein